MQRLHKLQSVKKSFFIVSSDKINYSCVPSNITTFFSCKVPKSAIFCLFRSAFVSFVVLMSKTCSCLLRFLRLFIWLPFLPPASWTISLVFTSFFKSMLRLLIHSLRHTLSDSSTYRSELPSILIGLSQPSSIFIALQSVRTISSVSQLSKYNFIPFFFRSSITKESRQLKASYKPQMPTSLRSLARVSSNLSFLLFLPLDVS